MGDAESERALSSWDNKNQIYKKWQNEFNIFKQIYTIGIVQFFNFFKTELIWTRKVTTKASNSHV
jgi:hypothetical protein